MGRLQWSISVASIYRVNVMEGIMQRMRIGNGMRMEAMRKWLQWWKWRDNFDCTKWTKRKLRVNIEKKKNSSSQLTGMRPEKSRMEGWEGGEEDRDRDGMSPNNEDTTNWREVERRTREGIVSRRKESLLRSTFYGLWKGLIHHIPVSRSTSVGRLRGKQEWILQSIRNTSSQEEQWSWSSSC